MSDHWLPKLGLIFATFTIAVSCNVQDRDRTKNQPEDLQGAIIMWVEVPNESSLIFSNDNVFQDRIEEFKELYPQTKVFVKYFSPGESLKLFAAQAKQGSGPDLLLVNSTSQIIQLIKLIKEQEFRAIDEFEIDNSRFSDETVKQVRYRDKTYGLPISLSTQLLCYNKDKVQKTPITLEDLIEQARQGYSVGMVSSLAETFWGTGIFGGKLFDDSGQLALSESEGWIRWMKWLKESQNEPNLILNKKKEILHQAFVEGKLAYLTCSSDLIPYFIEIMGNDKLGVTLLPAKANQPATPLLQVSALFFNRDSTFNQTRLAIKLAMFLSNREQQAQIQAAIHFIPSNQNVTLNRPLFPRRAIMHDQSRTALSISLDKLEGLDLISKEGNIFYQKVLEGEITPEQAASELTQIVNRQFEVKQ